MNKRWKRLSREANSCTTELQGHDDHWHETRKTAKKARYTVEACIPVFGTPAKKLAKQLEVVTELLGEHQDCAVAADTVAGLVTQQTGPTRCLCPGCVVRTRSVNAPTQIRHEFVDVVATDISHRVA